MKTPGRLARIGIVCAAVVAGLVLVAILLVVTNPGAPHAVLPQEPEILVIAHQGGNHLWPDNTMTAFRGATGMGVDVLEMDVHGSADGVPVVIHDDTVDRTTNGRGAVKDLSLEELKELDAAYRWPHHLEGDEYPYRGTGIRIPTLREVLEAFPDMPMVIEIKQREPSIVDTVGRLLQEFDREAITVIASFHPETMYEFREAFPDVPTSAVEPEVRTFYVLSSILLGRIYRAPFSAFQVPERAGDTHVVRPAFIRPASALGLDVHVWTVNELEQMRRLVDLGVDGIITDRPDLLLALLGR